MFKLLSKKYRDTKDLQIFAINCDEYNAPKACREVSATFFKTVLTFLQTFTDL